MTIANDASKAQIDAATPTISTWLSANAGSGKTRVLTDRVARLLLLGVPPQRILCLTYTKAAASEMQNRLFKRLGEWSMLDDAALTNSLAGLGVDSFDDRDRARTLFARAIETPGGLKIQTIHSFCASLLRQFPLEAGVSPQFKELDDRGQLRLIEDVLDELGVTDPGVLEALGQYYSGQTLSELAMAVAGAGEAFSEPHQAANEYFGIDPSLTDDDLLNEALLPGDLGLLLSLPDLLAQSDKVTDQKLATRLAGLVDTESSGRLDILTETLLTGATANQPFAAKIGRIPTSGMRTGALAPFLQEFERVMGQVEAACEKRQRRDAAAKTDALHTFASAFLPAYETAKTESGFLDFNDLISQARNLLQNVDMAWILFRLDGGIDHILVDEAQDTSPAQWSVIQTLSAEMAAGQGARDVPRTLFVVGDKKQSIYSFQGADARGFDTMRDTLMTTPGGEPGLRQRALVYSFRSSPAILQVVDSVFEGPVAAGLGDDISHRAFHTDLPGRVDLWPLEEVVEKQQDPPWHLPVDRTSEHSPRTRLANKIAEHIDGLLKTGAIVGENGVRRRIEAGDILILVRARNEVFDAVIRACKMRHLPIAGADQLRINAELAVRDVLALLSFVALQEDDLSLAAALRSPLFGWSEQDLFSLAQPRAKGTSLWRALRERAADYPDEVEKLFELRRRADVLRPYEMIELILTRMNGRRDLVARLGQEAEDGLDALLNQALAYEQTDVPTLTGFLARTQAEEVKIKRRIESGSGLIRVMTVHGAKGLEAPIVILPDTIHESPKERGAFIAPKDEMPVWNVASAEAPHQIRAMKDAEKEAAIEEENRLLYVAMTRAANWLIVAGAETKRMQKSTWWSSVEDAMQRLGAVIMPTGDPAALRMESGGWPSEYPARQREETPRGLDAELVALLAPPKGPPATAQVVSPSDLGGPKVLPGDPVEIDADTAKSRGTLIHRLLETLPTLPRTAWPEVAKRLTGDHEDSLLTEAVGVIDAMPELFSKTALSEVEITAESANGECVYLGAVDRLNIGSGTILISDFKTNTRVPATAEDVPAGILRQMGAYLEAAERIWPDHTVTIEIVWTKTAQRMVLPHAIVRDALKQTPIS